MGLDEETMLHAQYHDVLLIPQTPRQTQFQTLVAQVDMALKEHDDHLLD